MIYYKMPIKECTPDQIRNPATKRCVSRTSKLGISILAKQSANNSPQVQQPSQSSTRKASPKRKECSPDQIRNPKTMRCVSRTSKLGISILANMTPHVSPVSPVIPMKPLTPPPSMSSSSSSSKTVPMLSSSTTVSPISPVSPVIPMKPLTPHVSPVSPVSPVIPIKPLTPRVSPDSWDEWDVEDLWGHPKFNPNLDPNYIPVPPPRRVRPSVSLVKTLKKKKRPPLTKFQVYQRFNKLNREKFALGSNTAKRDLIERHQVNPRNTDSSSYIVEGIEPNMLSYYNMLSDKNKNLILKRPIESRMDFLNYIYALEHNNKKKI